MNLRQDITGVILAGGKSRRIGRNKALLTVEGEAFLTRIARAMRSVFHEVIVVSNDGTYRFLNAPVFKDIYQNCGPLAGIHSGLFHSKRRASFVTACDTPFISKELIEYILTFDGQGDVLIPSTGVKLHPLCGLYSRRCLPIIEDSLRGKRLRIQDLLGRLHTIIIPISPQLPFYRSDLLFNVNSMKDYCHVIHERFH